MDALWGSLLKPIRYPIAARHALSNHAGKHLAEFEP